MFACLISYFTPLDIMFILCILSISHWFTGLISDYINNLNWLKQEVEFLPGIRLQLLLFHCDWIAIVFGDGILLLKIKQMAVTEHLGDHLQGSNGILLWKFMRTYTVKKHSHKICNISTQRDIMSDGLDICLGILIKSIHNHIII